MRDMIYFPGFEVKNENWLKFALLYFDTLRPIIPYTVYSEERYLSDTFQRAAFTASAIVSCFSFYSLLTDQQNAFAPAVASAIIDGFAVKDAYSSLPQYVNSIREKSLARKYVAKIEALNRPVRKKWCR